MPNKILVTGGAGYIGSVLTRQLLEKGYHVRVMDRLMYGGEPIIDMFNYPNFEFVKGDVRNRADVERAVEGMDAIAHLAAIVGDPACAQDPELSRTTNFEGSKLLYDVANEKGVQRFVFASTCSNYGKMDDPGAYVNEDSKLAPVSLYAETKVATEQYLLNQPKTNNCKPTCLRFSTVYGLSLRPRFDLTVNEFTKELALDRELVVFGLKNHLVDATSPLFADADTAPERDIPERARGLALRRLYVQRTVRRKTVVGTDLEAGTGHARLFWRLVGVRTFRKSQRGPAEPAFRGLRDTV